MIGDAIMATWGTRGDQPDHAARAADAGAGAAGRDGPHRRRAPRLAALPGGVNSGEALVGVLGGESGRTYTVIGDTVNVAARLESQAPPGGW